MVKALSVSYHFLVVQVGMEEVRARPQDELLIGMAAGALTLSSKTPKTGHLKEGLGSAGPTHPRPCNP